MRTASEIRDRFLADLKGIVQRPSMYGGNQSGVELFMLNFLERLCYIDEREADWEKVFQELKRRRQFTCRGVVGSFRERVAEAGDFTAEVTSVYAAVAHRLGYLTVSPTLSNDDFRRLRRGLRTACRKRDWRRSEVIERLGPPSLSIGGALIAYVASTRSEGWIFFDFDRSSADWQDRDYLLREVRIPARQFAQELTFTPHGRRLREGVVGRTSAQSS